MQLRANLYLPVWLRIFSPENIVKTLIVFSVKEITFES